MKRRDFLVSSAGFAGAMVPLIGSAASKPCPPGTVSVGGGTSATTTCVAPPTTAANWLARSTDPGVVFAYDFSAPPANGGDWKWGSLRAAGPSNSRVTCQMQNYSQNPSKVAIDTAVYPPGSSASLRYDINSQTGELGLNWRAFIDDYKYQFGAGQEFWIQWRVRMNQTYARHLFKSHPDGVDAWSGSYTSPKLNFLSAGPQYPYCAGAGNQNAHPYYMFEGPGTSQQNNSIEDCDVDSIGEIEITTATGYRIDTTNAYMYPYSYISKYYESLTTRGQDSSYYTDRNEGIEANHVAACQRQVEPTLYTDYTKCFNYEPDQWMTIMLHVILGPYGTAVSSLGQTRTGYTNSTIEYWGGYDPAVVPGAKVQLLHRRSGVVLPVDSVNGSQGIEKYGQFAVTTFMTYKWNGPNGSGTGDPHPLANVWFSQIIWSKTKPADPV